MTIPDAELLDYLDGNLDAERTERLEAALRSNVELADRFRRLAERELELRRVVRAAREGEASDSAVAPPTARQRLRWAWRAAAAVGIVALALVLVPDDFFGPGRVLQPGDPRSSRPAVELAGGCEVIATPNTQYRIVTPTRVRLERGTLSVSIAPGSADGLEVVTDAGTATALGTRFIVDARELERSSRMGASPTALATLSVLVLSGAVHVANPFGQIEVGPGDRVFATDDAPPVEHARRLADRFADLHEPVAYTEEVSVSPSSFPLDIAKTPNAASFERAIGLDLDEPLLRENGFVVLPLPRLIDEGEVVAKDDLRGVYDGLENADLPVFVTVDSVLHCLHVSFERILADVETRVLSEDLAAVLEQLERSLRGRFAQTAGEEREGIRRAWVFVTVGRRLLDPSVAVAEEIAPDVTATEQLILAHAEPAPLPVFGYREDFTQYRPRGHYTATETLERYFRAMMWCGRITFHAVGGEPHGPAQRFRVSEAEARRQTLGAIELTRLFAADSELLRRWERIETITAFFVGEADDLGLPEYRITLARVLGNLPSRAVLSPATHRDFLADLAQFGGPAMHSGDAATIDPDPARLAEALSAETGFRLFGQRLVTDGFVLQQLCYPSVGRAHEGNESFTVVDTPAGRVRGFVRGLDVAAALGSERALEILEREGDTAYGSALEGRDRTYHSALAEVRADLRALPERAWHANLYWSRLALVEAALAERGAGYPSFMQTDAWHDQSLSTALAAWAQLRHETLLYAKQSRTMWGGADVPPGFQGVVEPAPEVYARALETVRMLRAGLESLDVPLGRDTSLAFGRFDDTLLQLLRISEKQLRNEPLSSEEQQAIKGMGHRLRPPVPNARRSGTQASDPTSVIADVHTEPNSGQALEVASGHVDLIVVAYPLPNGTHVLVAGPVLSYHEFKSDTRLTDAEWRARLEAGEAPRPQWTRSFRR